MRVSHWYKNLLAFLGVIFERRILDLPVLAHVGVVFLLLCLISSSNYLVNDVMDKDQDRLNQIKNRGVLASMNPVQLLAVAVGLFAASFIIAWVLVPELLLIVIFIAGLGQVYNLVAKRIPILDVVVLIMIYVLRIYSGYISVQVIPSSLIVLPIVTLALFLIFIKKRSMLLILGEEKAIEFRESYAVYSLKRTTFIVKMLGVGLAIVYLLYVVINEKFNKIVLLATIPAAFLLIRSVSTLSFKEPELGIFLWKIFSRRAVISCSVYIIVLYLVDILFL